MSRFSKALILFSLSGLFAINVFGQAAPADPSLFKKDSKDSSKAGGGIAVSPSHIYFTCKPGESKVTSIKVSNNTSKAQKFELKFSDSDMNVNGKSTGTKGDKTNSLNDWITFSPSFFEVLPGTSQKISVSLNVPDLPEAYRAKWGMLYVNQVKERKTIDIAPGDNTIGMGVIPSFGFGVNIFQNPPNVAVKKVEIQSFSNITKTTDNHVVLQIKAKNVGDGISFCTTYLELVNSRTGKKLKFGKKSFTALPAHDREFTFDLPPMLEKGHYTAIGVIDFGSREEIEAAEIEFDIK